MATYYVSSVDGDNASDGSTWALAKATVVGALAVATTTGDVIFVDSAHSYTATAALSWGVGTSNIYVSIISVDRNGSSGTGHNGWLAGAKEEVSGDFAFNINSVAGSLFVYGFTLKQVAGAGNSKKITVGSVAGFNNVELNNCTLTLEGTSVLGYLALGTIAAGNRLNNIRLIDCTVNVPNFTGSGQPAIRFESGNCEIYGLTIGYSGSNKPLVLFGADGSGFGNFTIADSDLSGYNTTSGAYFYVVSLNATDVVVRNVKLSSTPSIVGSFGAGRASSFTLINVDSGDTVNVFEYRNYYGTLLESSSIYADDGSTVGGVNYSWQIVTTANCNEMTPFVCPWQMRWSDSTASTTVGFRVVHDSATDLNDRNLWSEIEYVSNASFPEGTLVSSRNSNPFDAAAVDWTNDSEAWTGTGGFGTENTQTVSSTFTPAEKSLIRGRIIVAATSKTLYLDPLLRIS